MPLRNQGYEVLLPPKLAAFPGAAATLNQLYGLWRAWQAWTKEARAEDTEPESTARTVWVIPNTYPHDSMSRASVRRLNYEKVL